MPRLLGRSKTIDGAYADAVSIYKRYFTGQKAAIRQYLKRASVPALHIGASRSHLVEWLETDVAIGGGLVFLDATKPFPMPDRSFQYVYAEHMIEHVSRDEARVMLSEARRILTSGGVLRLTTPDLGFLLKLYDGGGDLGERYMRWIAAAFLKDAALARPSIIINNAFRAWGHQFLYDAETLEADLRNAGFARVERVRYGESSHEMLRGIERHHLNVGHEDLIRAETMVFEAS